MNFLKNTLVTALLLIHYSAFAVLTKNERMLFKAIKEGDITEVQRLLQLNDIKINNALNDLEQSPLYASACVNNGNNGFEIFKLLIKYGADIDFKKSNGSSVLNTTIAHGQFDMFTTLLKKGANPNTYAATIYSKETPLHNLITLWAGNDNFLKCIKLMLCNNALPNALNKNNESPLDYINKNNASFKSYFQEIIDYKNNVANNKADSLIKAITHYEKFDSLYSKNEWLTLALHIQDYTGIITCINNKTLRAIPTLQMIARKKHLFSSTLALRLFQTKDAQEHPESLNSLTTIARRNNNKYFVALYNKYQLLQKIVEKQTISSHIIPQEIINSIALYF